ncbi:MAG TPA: AbrB/MazE/SpoVT family DNA-binding domain-containing protein [Opitutaceae bacterium]|nr:AbrB/MazE/SpoVT family DNA-binding domain-containing protein [Opitutaceae bacterium]
MRITRKGQVTIPREIREEFGLNPGTEVTIVTENGKVILRRAMNVNHLISSWFKTSIGAAKSGVRTDDALKLTRSE